MVGEAACEFRRALQIKPDFREAHSSLLLTLHYAADVGARSLFAEHRQWDEVHARPFVKHIAQHGNDRTPERRLRIGYVSSDFREHAVARFIEGLLAAHDRKNVEVFCFADSLREDAYTARLRGYADQWRQICRMDDARVAELIRGDGMDILVDLAGHTGGNRLLVFARNPARCR